MDFKKLIYLKRSQGGVFGLSFATIFSIILIIFFILVAIIAVNAFLGWQRCANIGLFIEAVKTEIDVNAWRSEDYSNPKFVEPIPSNIEQVCFVNLTSPVSASATDVEKGVMDHIKYEGYNNADNNLYLYSSKATGCNSWAKISHVDLSARNPICFKVIKGQVTMKIERKFDYTAVKVSL